MVSKNVPNRPRKSGQTRKKFAGPRKSIPTTLNFADLEAKYKGNSKPVNATRQGNSAVRTRAPVTFRHGTRRNLAEKSPFTAAATELVGISPETRRLPLLRCRLAE